jgi:hypothetical protein
VVLAGQRLSSLETRNAWEARVDSEALYGYGRVYRYLRIGLVVGIRSGSGGNNLEKQVTQVYGIGYV